MANCPSLVFWSPVPAGSTLKVSATGDQNVFDVTVGRSRNGQPLTPFGFKQVVPGPASQAIAEGENWAFTPVVSVFVTPQSPVTLSASVVDASGNVVTLANGGGGIKLECQWQFASEGASMIKILVTA